MSVPSIQTAFVAGEIAPSLFGHVDLAKYHVAASTMRNLFVNYRGGAYSRAGTAYCLRSKQPYGTPSRLIRFQFNINQGYALEFGQNYMRVFANGAPVVETGVPITAISNANPCRVTAPGAAYVSGDWVILGNINGVAQLSNNAYVVALVSPGVFNLLDLNGAPVDSTTFGVYTGGGSSFRVFTLATPWAAADLPLLKFTQSADVMTLVHPSYPPYDLSRITANQWTLTQSTFAATIDPPSSVDALATTHPSTGTTPHILPAAYAYVVTSVDSVTGQESVASKIANIIDGVDIAATAGSNIITWTSAAKAGTYNVYRAPTSYNSNPGDPAFAAPVPAGALFGYVGTSYGLQLVDSNITADLSQVPPLHKNPFAPGQAIALVMVSGGAGYSGATVSIVSATGSGFVGQCIILGGEVQTVIIENAGENYRSGDAVVFAGDGAGAAATVTVGPLTGTYPGTVAYFQQRRIYAASDNQPDTFWMSKPGQYLNFDSSIPAVADDAITGTPWAQQVNGVQFMVSMPGGLVVLTGLGAWQVTGAGGSAQNPQPITPSSEQAQPQAFNGCHDHIGPIPINYDILYVQSKGSIVRDLSYNYWVNIYTGADLTQLSSHLFTGYQLVEWAWCEEPYKIVWAVRSDGALLSLTYLKEQEVSGWARHDTLGQFVSVCSVTEIPVDALYAIVARPVGGTSGTRFNYFVERMDNRIWQTAEDPWCIDCAVSNPMSAPPAILFATTATGVAAFSADTPIFSPSNVGQIIRMGGGIATVTSYLSATELLGTWNLSPAATQTDDPDSNVIPQQSGTWTISQPVTLLYGLNHLAGLTVTGLADGVVVPPTIVANDGTITLPFSASDIKIGLGFRAQLQSVYLDTGGSPTIQGRRKNVTAVTVRVEASAGLKSGTNQPDGSAQSPASLSPAWAGLKVVADAGGTYTSPGGQIVVKPFTGDERVNLGPNWAKPGQVAVQQDNPLPMQITALIPETLDGDIPEQTYAPQQQSRQAGGPPPQPRPPGLWQLRA